MRQLLCCIFLILLFISGYKSGEWITKRRAYIPDWTPRLPYKQFFEEERGTSSPIKTIYIKNWTMWIETVDGNKDLIPLEIKYR